MGKADNRNRKTVKLDPFFSLPLNFKNKLLIISNLYTKIESKMDTLYNLNNLPQIVELLKNHSTPLQNTEDLYPLIDYIGDAKYVLLGEASYGTHAYCT